MLRNLLHKKDDEGFTLIELLVVILIIGILAAIALPSFLGQSDKAKDASAKSDARNMVSQVESCYTTTSDYGQCTTTAPTQLDTGGIGGSVAATAGSGSTYDVTATSKTGTTFSIHKTSTGVTRDCVAAAGAKGGCNAGTW